MQVDVRGLIATAFDTTTAGARSPHAHVVIFSNVQIILDNKWEAVDESPVRTAVGAWSDCTRHYSSPTATSHTRPASSESPVIWAGTGTRRGRPLACLCTCRSSSLEIETFQVTPRLLVVAPAFMAVALCCFSQHGSRPGVRGLHSVGPRFVLCSQSILLLPTIRHTS